MKKRKRLIMALLVIVLSLAVVLPASAVDKQGCTPGYWKNEKHLDSWAEAGVNPNATWNQTFGGYLTLVDDLTLFEAVNAKGGKLNYLVRTLTALYLSQLHPGVTVFATMDQFWGAFSWAVAFWDDGTVKEARDFLDNVNEYECPLD